MPMRPKQSSCTKFLNIQRSSSRSRFRCPACSSSSSSRNVAMSDEPCRQSATDSISALAGDAARRRQGGARQDSGGEGEVRSDRPTEEAEDGHESCLARETELASDQTLGTKWRRRELWTTREGRRVEESRGGQRRAEERRGE
eukprot:755207-Hanusia_phi.AAC.3